MSTQMNYQGGVNKKTSGPTASCSQAESGEVSKPQENFNWTHEKSKKEHTAYPDTTRQMNFKNGN